MLTMKISLRHYCLFVIIVTLSGCASVDFDYPKPASSAYTDTDDTYLGKQLVGKLGFFSLGVGVTVYVRARTESGELLGIVVHDGRNREQPMTMMAERGAIVTGKAGPRVVMINGNRQETRKDGALTLLHFERYEFEIAGLAESPHPRWREPRERYLDELFFSTDRAEKVWNYQLLRMEGHHRLVSPLLNICFVVVGLAFLLSGEFNRRGQLKRVVGCIGVIIAIEISLLSIKSSGPKFPELTGLIYLCPLLPALLGGYVLFVRNRPHRRAVASLPA